jgi:hypothetical protein
MMLYANTPFAIKIGGSRKRTWAGGRSYSLVPPGDYMRSAADIDEPAPVPLSMPDVPGVFLEISMHLVPDIRTPTVL